MVNSAVKDVADFSTTLCPNETEMYIGIDALTASRGTVTAEKLTQASFGPEKIAFLALASIKGVGTKSLAAIAGGGQTFESVLAIEAQHDAIELLRRHGARIDGASGADWKVVRDQAIARAQRWADDFAQDGIQLIFQTDDTFPKRLLDLPSPPFWLFVKGNANALSAPSISIVGTRSPSEDGEWLTKYVGACLSIWNTATVSGLATGIDQLAHEMSIRANVPTVAFLGTGILSDYPRGAGDLRERIIEGGGALATEYLPREGYSAENFVRRNRLQAALGKILIPTEWSPKSGTAHTVRFATQLRRPIAFLRLPDWEEGRGQPMKGYGSETGRVFTIPGDEEDFRTFVSDAIAETQPPAPAETQKNQLSLFSEK